MRSLIIVVVIQLALLTWGISQDTTYQDGLQFKTLIPPVTLITLGLVLDNQDTKTGFRNWVRDRYAIPNTQIDDYLQHLPIAMMVIGDVGTRVSGSEVHRQARHLLVTQAMTLGTVYLLKELTGHQRPSGGSLSFPSGHTAYAFAGATVMYYAFADHSKWLAYLGYLPATITGVYRMLKDKHWISDVVVGAGIGILSAQLSYHLNIWNSGRRQPSGTSKTRVSISLPSNSYGLGAYLHF